MLATAAFSWPAEAQLGCGDHRQITNRLAADYSETRVGAGLDGFGSVPVKVTGLRAKLRPGWAIPRYPSTRIGGWRLIQTIYMDLAA